MPPTSTVGWLMELAAKNKKKKEKSQRQIKFFFVAGLISLPIFKFAKIYCAQNLSVF
jgi:hypothetical protein